MADIALTYAGETHTLNYRLLSALAESLPNDKRYSWLGNILLGLGIPSISEKLVGHSFVTQEQRDGLWAQGNIDLRRALAGDWHFVAGLTDQQAQDLMDINDSEILQLVASLADDLRSAGDSGRLSAEAWEHLLQHLHGHPNPAVRLELTGYGRVPERFRPAFADCLRHGRTMRGIANMKPEDLSLLETLPASVLVDMCYYIESIEDKALRKDAGRTLARHPDPSVRLALAENCEAPAEVLRLLLADAEPDVAETARQSLARQNQGARRSCRRHRLREDSDPIVMEQDSLDE